MKRLAALLAAGLVLTSLTGCIRAARHLGQRVAAAVVPPDVHAEGQVPPGLQEKLDSVVRGGPRGITAIAMKDGKQIFRLDVGKMDHTTRYEIASATKWMTAALVMSVVDEGKLTLDEPISKVLPEYTGEASKITLRMLLAQTAGLGNLRDRVDVRQDPHITLAQSAQEIAARPLAHPPGELFEYGGPQFQVAGAMVEKVTGKHWAALFDERIARPLGMTNTTWLHLPARGTSATETLNPLLQGGVVTTADDYMRFLTMVAQNGQYNGQKILSPRAVNEMETAQTLGKAKGWLPPGVRGGNAEYALGNWCEAWTADKRCTLVSSPGAYGTLPWIDRKSGTYGIFFVHDMLIRIGRDLRSAREMVLSANP